MTVLDIYLRNGRRGGFVWFVWMYYWVMNYVMLSVNSVANSLSVTFSIKPFSRLVCSIYFSM